jgi:hypothetical protein
MVTKADLIRANEQMKEALKYSEAHINPWTLGRLRQTQLLREELSKLREKRERNEIRRANRKRIR